MLAMNGERLDVQYKQRCQGSWGMQQGFAVSFLVPAGVLSSGDSDKVQQAKCAAPECRAPAGQQCSRCRVRRPLTPGQHDLIVREIWVQAGI